MEPAVSNNLPTTPYESSPLHRVSYVLGRIRAIAYLPSYVMTCDEQMSRIRDLFYDYDHPGTATSEPPSEREDAPLTDHNGLAQRHACGAFVDDLPDARYPMDLKPHELTGYTRQTLAAFGWAGDIPTFSLSLDGMEGGVFGYHDRRTGVIHLHPEFLGVFYVLHELAHWLTRQQTAQWRSRRVPAHGPRFCRNYLGLVRAAHGQDTADDLEAAFVRYGIRL
jgi:hypothetical protein